MRFSKSFIFRAVIGILLINSTIALVANQPQVYDQGNKHFMQFVTDCRQDGSLQSRSKRVSLADLIVAVCDPKMPSFVRPFVWNRVFPLKDCPASQCVSSLVYSMTELSPNQFSSALQRVNVALVQNFVHPYQPPPRPVPPLKRER